ncbi:MAG: RNA polymerase sporulation sigma factor SigK, partial [Clostridia bacterium]|nr:RNA polymerase sporulation sigma factor SigK [Clostridia bacterium]
MFQNLLSILLYVTLHLNTNSSFPPPMSKSEEAECLQRMKNGDLNAKNKLIEHNLRLVAHIIKKYYSNYFEQDDLISIGSIGLIKAINSFDYEKGTRLATYAAKCIENEILMYFRSTKKSSQDVSLNEPIESDSDGNPITLMDVMYSDDTIADDIDLKIKIKKLSRYIDYLTNEKEKTIIIKRYGLDGKKPLTQREIAKSMGISRSY